ncbi:hypothetical protein D3C81_1624600 [compost metagenome]
MTLRIFEIPGSGGNHCKGSGAGNAAQCNSLLPFIADRAGRDRADAAVSLEHNACGRFRSRRPIGEQQNPLRISGKLIQLLQLSPLHLGDFEGYRCNLDFVPIGLCLVLQLLEVRLSQLRHRKPEASAFGACLRQYTGRHPVDSLLILHQENSVMRSHFLDQFSL